MVHGFNFKQHGWFCVSNVETSMNAFMLNELQMQNRYKIIRELFLRPVLWFVKKTFRGPSLSLQNSNNAILNFTYLLCDQRREASGKETILGWARAMLRRQKASFYVAVHFL